ncbi:SKP1-interacting partner 15 [Turnera subulata]|uniref:SKP1-interacting partner 15 n=1 Tax=Turnera subulata TaxID=218843 RepID=A0A9Q0F695_9ROSI|nr:SKP1-interacting partner 15 [Turnera subulata]
MEESPMNKLPLDTLRQIFSSLPLRQIMICRSVCKSFNQLLTSPSFVHLISTQLPPLRFLALRPPHIHLHHHRHHHHHHHHHSTSPPPPPSLHVYDPDHHQWLRFHLNFLPFRSPHPVASAGGLLYLWAESLNSPDSVHNSGTSSSSSGGSNHNSKSLVVCNPLTRQYKVLPQLGSAWSRHGAVLVDSVNRVMVLTELAALYLSNGATARNAWHTFPANLPSKPRSPVLVWGSAFALCDVGSPWRPQWKLFTSKTDLYSLNNHNNWLCLEKQEWSDIFDIIKRPRLVRGNGRNLLMIGGLKSTYSLNPSCSTILILRLDLERMEWEEAGRMPPEMYRCFQESSKLKVFGGGDRVCFSARRVGKLALWDGGGGAGPAWRWIEGMPCAGDGLCRGFAFEASLTALP